VSVRVFKASDSVIKLRQVLKLYLYAQV